MMKVGALLCACAVACSQALAAAAGRSDSGNFLDDKQWLTTISQYDKEVGQWNKFRDEVEDDYFRTGSMGKPFNQGLDSTRDPCLKMKCSHHKVCVAQDQQTAICISHRRLTQSMKEAGLNYKHRRSGPTLSTCKQCPVVSTSPVCGSDSHTYASQCKLEYQACISRKRISVKCKGHCPCSSDLATYTQKNERRNDTKLFKVVKTQEDCEKLQEDLDKLEDWTFKWQMKFNADKCKDMHLGKNNPNYGYTMQGSTLGTTTTQEKDLGIIKDKMLKPSGVIKDKTFLEDIVKAVTNNNALRDMFAKCRSCYTRL